MTTQPQTNFTAVLIFIDLAQLIFAWITKTATESLLIVTHTPHLAPGERQAIKLAY